MHVNPLWCLLISTASRNVLVVLSWVIVHVKIQICRAQYTHSLLAMHQYTIDYVMDTTILNSLELVTQ